MPDKKHATTTSYAHPMPNIASRKLHSTQLQQSMNPEINKQQAISPATSVKVLEAAEYLATRSWSLASALREKLEPIMKVVTHPEEVKTAAEGDRLEYPPLFNALRESLDNIESALRLIERCIEHTDLP